MKKRVLPLLVGVFVAIPTLAARAATLDGTLTVYSLPTSSYVGEVVTLWAQTPTDPSGTPAAGGPVSFFDNGSQIGSHFFSGGGRLGTGQVFSDSAINYVFTTPGAHTITASWPGDANYMAGGSNSYTQTVLSGPAACPCTNNPTTTIVGIGEWDGGYPYGNTDAVNVVVIAPGVFPVLFLGSPPGTATLLIDGQTIGTGIMLAAGPDESSTYFSLSQLAIGAHAVVANYGGYASYQNYTFSPGSASGTYTIIKGSTLITLHASALTNSTTGNVSLGADIHTYGLLNGSPVQYCSSTPVTGTVTFWNAAVPIATVPVSTTFGAGGCVQTQNTIITLPSGTYSLKATYSGDSFFNGSESTAQTLSVVAAPLTLQVPNAISVNASGPGGAVVTYIVNSTGGFGQVTIQCVPASGSLFPIGITQVNCTATDQAGSQVHQFQCHCGGGTWASSQSAGCSHRDWPRWQFGREGQRCHPIAECRAPERSVGVRSAGGIRQRGTGAVGKVYPYRNCPIVDHPSAADPSRPFLLTCGRFFVEGVLMAPSMLRR